MREKNINGSYSYINNKIVFEYISIQYTLHGWTSIVVNPEICQHASEETKYLAPVKLPCSTN